MNTKYSFQECDKIKINCIYDLIIFIDLNHFLKFIGVGFIYTVNFPALFVSSTGKLLIKHTSVSSLFQI